MSGSCERSSKLNVVGSGKARGGHSYRCAGLGKESKENHGHGAVAFADGIKLAKGHTSSTFIGAAGPGSGAPYKSGSHKSHALSNRNLSFNTANSSGRMMNHPILGAGQAARDGPAGPSSSAAHHGHQKSSGNLESGLGSRHPGGAPHKATHSQHSSSSIGKTVRITSMKQKNPANFNSNNQKKAEPLPSNRNANGKSLFVSGLCSQGTSVHGGDVQMNENLQKSGDTVHGKVER